MWPIWSTCRTSRSSSALTSRNLWRVDYLPRPCGSAELNVVNSSDCGRQVQLSFYSGPVPFQPPGSSISEPWKELGWNPIQTGDAFGNSSKILTYKVDKNQLYVKCVPMQWPLKNVPGDCTFEVWLQLDGSAVAGHCRLINNRIDRTQYSARAQELPAVYVNAPYGHLMTCYTGTEPFSNGPLTEIHNRLDIEHHWTNLAGFRELGCPGRLKRMGLRNLEPKHCSLLRAGSSDKRGPVAQRIAQPDTLLPIGPRSLMRTSFTTSAT